MSSGNYGIMIGAFFIFTLNIEANFSMGNVNTYSRKHHDFTLEI